jgi:hypothetical protein
MKMTALKPFLRVGKIYGELFEIEQNYYETRYMIRAFSDNRYDAVTRLQQVWLQDPFIARGVVSE